ncbi:TPA: hypothetical protein ACH3X3_004472 [Trebouxia sp. C0006]
MASLTCASHVLSAQSQHDSSVHRIHSSCQARMSRVRNQRNCKKAAAGSIYRVSCSASDFEEGELISGVKAGDKLKVKESRIIYHSPKHKEGLDLNGMEGELMEVIEKYQGKQLSANLPYKTLFMIPKDDGKDQKLIAHLAAGEFDKV